MSFLQPVTSSVLGALDSTRAKELYVWSKNHLNIFDLRIHSIFSCPFLAYMPNYFLNKDNKTKWANWLYGFYKTKHQEENHCTCSKEIIRV